MNLNVEYRGKDLYVLNESLRICPQHSILSLTTLHSRSVTLSLNHRSLFPRNIPLHNQYDKFKMYNLILYEC